MTPEQRAAQLVATLNAAPLSVEDLEAWTEGQTADAIERAVAAEREACAKVAEATAIMGAMGIVLCHGEQVAAAIRARGG